MGIVEECLDLPPSGPKKKTQVSKIGQYKAAVILPVALKFGILEREIKISE